MLRLADRIDPIFALRNKRVIAAVLRSDRRNLEEVEVGDAAVHLHEAVQWLFRAQDAGGGLGVSHSFNLFKGWEKPYPETTGYIIPTLWDWAAAAGSLEAGRRAETMSEWLVRIQHPDGWFCAGVWDERRTPAPSVFNSAQVVFGLVRSYRETARATFRDAAVRAARWLCARQEADGSWRRFVYRGSVHAYEVRVAWACLLLRELDSGADYEGAARRNLDFSAALQEANGWWRHAAFGPGGPSFLHTIAYTVEGILESGVLLGEPRYVEAARRTADVLLRLQQSDGSLAGAFDRQWRGAAYRCLTGIAQTAVIWARLHQLTGEGRYADAALRANRYLKACQRLHWGIPELRGALAGSRPCWGRYMAMRFPNWAAKFFADALLAEARLVSLDLRRAVLAGTSSP